MTRTEELATSAPGQASDAAFGDLNLQHEDRDVRFQGAADRF
jgi:hypothetical protein